MDLLLIVLDDWEGLIQASACWGQLNDQIEIRFLNGSVDQDLNMRFAEHFNSAPTT